MLDTHPRTSKRMAKQRRRNTTPEMNLRRALHCRGFRYCVDVVITGLPRRRADLTFASSRVVVFVDGCFSHSCPEHSTVPKRNAMWWTTKLSRTVERDRDTDKHLFELGWKVARVWEHENSASAADRVAAAVRWRSHP